MSRAETTSRPVEFHARLPCAVASVPEARARVREWCSQAGMRHDLIVNVELAVTEAASNAVRHSDCSDFQIDGWVESSSLIISVSDKGVGLHSPNPGLGLGWEIIHGVTASVDIEQTRPGTRVTMRFDRHPHHGTV